MKITLGFILTAALCLTAPSCSDKWEHHDLPDDGGGDTEEPTPYAEMEKELWFDASANFQRFSTKEGISHWLDKTKETGFNKIVVDVRSVQGDVLYKSDFLTEATTLGGVTVHRDWDYLQYFIDEAHKRKLKVCVSTTIFPAGSPSTRSGPAYRDTPWAKKTCMQYKTTGMKDIKDDNTKVAAFLNPVLPEVQENALRMIEEIVTKYDIDAYALDYCRYPDGESDFSAETRSAFEGYIGQRLTDWPGDVFTYNPDGTHKAGKYYKKWWEFRSKVIRDFVAEVRKRIKAIKPEVKLEYWAASWWQGLYNNGQNWASPSYDPSGEYGWWASPDYFRTGFADQLDTFLLGTYLSKIYGPNDPESIEYGIARAKRIIGRDCTIYGTVQCADPKFDIGEAVYLCMKSTQGLMVFDIVHVINNNKWDAIKQGISRAEKELTAEKQASGK